MTKIESILKKLVAESLQKFEAITEPNWNNKPIPAKWSKKEILGHLTDSAHNNLRRFIITQYEQNNKIVYNQDEWVSINAYQHIPAKDIIQLWKLLNLQIAHVTANIPDEHLLFTCDTGKQGQDLKTLQFLMDDYIVHMNHHLHKIFAE